LWGFLGWERRWGGNYAARPGNIKVVAVVAALLLPPPQRKFQLYFELSAVCSYANMRNCISRSQQATVEGAKEMAIPGQSEMASQ